MLITVYFVTRNAASVTGGYLITSSVFVFAMDGYLATESSPKTICWIPGILVCVLFLARDGVAKLSGVNRVINY